LNRRLPPVPWAIAGGAAVLLLVGGGLFWHAQSQVNHVPLSAEPKRVTVVTARASTYRPTRRYVGSLDPWVEAKVGPQFVSAYVDTVLVRPGAVVKRGDVLATLDCRNASALNRAVGAQARAVQAMQEAVEHEAERMSQLQDGGFVSANEIEQKTADSASKQSQYLSLQAQMLETSLKVSDCVLRAPFDGEIADRMADPGAFAKPGTSIVSVVDRNVIRLAADVPEDDFAAVAPNAPARIHVVATGEELTRPISRRAPAADPTTRTVHIEIDIPDPTRRIPVYTTAEISVDVGEPSPATELPLAAATIRGSKAQVFVVSEGKAHAQPVVVQGEVGGTLYVEPTLKPGALLVLEGRTLLNDRDPVVYGRLSEQKDEKHAELAPSPDASQPKTEEATP
jgi:membrane fusion protein (multidrug efflux system)